MFCRLVDLLKNPETTAPRPDLFQLPRWKTEAHCYVTMSYFAAGDGSWVWSKVFVLILMMTMLKRSESRSAM
jgi:hypothetical protein